MMWANLSAHFYPARLSFAQNADASARTDVLTVDVVVAEFGEENIAQNDCFLTRAWPTGEPKERAPVTFMNDAGSDEIVILAVIKNRKPYHSRIFHGTTHQLVILNAVSIISNGDNAGLPEGADRC